MKPTDKRCYVKPMIVYEDYGTCELQGSPEMIEQYRSEASAGKDYSECPLEMVCKHRI
jgi:hypothetical protein